ncbi:MAG: SIR2 family protein [candidate division Zixibacteria bacterium]
MREISAQEFARRLRSSICEQNGRFTFFIGAGCSISSEIPGAGTLVEKWLRKLKDFKTGNADDLGSWENELFPDYDPDNPASSYSNVIEELFYTPQERQREIETIVAGKDPGFGYAVLAHLITHDSTGEQCNSIITTNFDDMIADALYLYTNKKPVVIAHESLIGFAKITDIRPTVFKIHGDARLAPMNTETETSEIADGVKKALSSMLSESGLVFIGYGGNDKTIAEILYDLPTSSLPWGIYWVGDNIPDTEIGTWLKDRKAIWVRHRDFDELMLLIRNEFELKHPDEKRLEKIMTTYKETFKNLMEKLDKKEDSPEKKILEDAADKAASEFTDWWSVALEAQKYEKSDPDKAERIYVAGLDKFPGSADFLNRYAAFLYTHRKFYDKAEDYFKMNAEGNPNNPNYLGNYALVLHNIRKDFNNAAKYYEKAIQADPGHANNMGNYAGLLLLQGNYDRGIEYCEKALELSDRDDLNLECSFYKYAHIRDEASRKEALNQIKHLIESKIRSENWDPEDNVNRAIQDSHPQPEFLKILAKVLSDEVDAKELEKFDIWKDIPK